MRHNSRADLFDGAVSLSTSRNIIRIGDFLFPRLFGGTHDQWSEREESEVAVGHVVVLGAEQKPSGDWKLRMTVHDHCVTSHI